MTNSPLIVDIKRHSLEDGPGIRSVVFFKGCPLRCVFCQNPEAQNPWPEIAFSSRKCVQCGQCESACKQDAIDLNYPGRVHRDKCIRCNACAKVCPSSALRKIGTYYPTETLAELLLRDLPFYRHSGGGVTLSGGECTLYPDYLEPLLKLLKAKNIHIVLETSGYFDYAPFKQKILPYVDLIYYDIKIADAEAHRRYTGKTNKRILDNLRRLLKEKGVKVHPRIPIIPHITAVKENLEAIVKFLSKIGADSVSLLPYNPLGIDIYENLGRQRPAVSSHFMTPVEEKEVYSLFKEIIDKKKFQARNFGRSNEPILLNEVTN